MLVEQGHKQKERNEDVKENNSAILGAISAALIRVSVI
jgi:hypothetical protein